ncbi:5-guanidino-2-oxopentanoate decarboxylase [Rhodoferax sp.]|jgi:acetolactate synthase-1/2/3 large subunit|uniref:5-guanidino-2-oxopentanoate decarboxylase n=1 Tax=Rhodoferax sp. TaxID=50421 RepID=UPI0037847C47
MNAQPQTLSGQLIDLLLGYGVDTVFGIAGVHTVELYRGLAERRMRHVTARHEQSLGFMADGYARVTGRPGVCFVITGPGLTNILTAMAQAYADSVPMLVVSGVNPAGRMDSGDGYLHELPHQQAMTTHVCAFSHTIQHPAELPQVLARAFAVFDAARPRPVHIEIPLHLMAAPAESLQRKAPARLQSGPAAHSAICAAASALASAQQPLMLVGGGAVHAGADVAALAERLDAPVVMTINARGLLAPDHPLGVSASPSFAAVRSLVAQSDVVLAVGTELGPTDYNSYEREPFQLPGRLMRIEIDAQHMVRNHPPDIALLGDAKASVSALSQELGSANPQSMQAVPPSARLHPEPAPLTRGAQRAHATRVAGYQELAPSMRADLDFLHALRDALPNARFVGDSTRLVYAGNMGFAALQARTWFNASVGFGALGYGMPAAIGAALGEPERCVVCLAGDGGFQFTLAEMGTAVEVGAKLTVVLLNNQGYGEIKSAMQAAGVTPLGVDLHTPDFVAAALAYGWQARRFIWPTHLGAQTATAHTTPASAPADALNDATLPPQASPLHQLAGEIAMAVRQASAPLLIELMASTSAPTFQP